MIYKEWMEMSSRVVKVVEESAVSCSIIAAYYVSLDCRMGFKPHR